MEDKIECPKCHKMNDINKFCIFCGEKLPITEERIKLMNDNPEPYCLNCGRSVEKGQAKCECGYGFVDITCPECNTENEYTNRFCTSCGNKLWKSDVYDYKYCTPIFENDLMKKLLPDSLRNTLFYKRSKDNRGTTSADNIDKDINWTIKKLESEDLNTDKHLYEICSRWKIVSPNNCINCLKIHSKVCSCMTPFLTDEKRIESLKSGKNNYIEPVFDIKALKWTSKNKNESYLRSLAPAIGESQFEYRERLKLEFMENINRKKQINESIAHKKLESSNQGKKEFAVVSPSRINSNDPPVEMWDMDGITQDMWERELFEEMERQNEERLEHWEEFWEN